MMSILQNQHKVLVTGGTGMVGVALQRVMPSATYVGSEYDLTNYQRTVELFEKFKPSYVIHLAAKVSGMKGNMDAIGEHYTDNVLMNTNVLDVSRKFGVKKLLSTLSTCVYPDDAKYPLVEDSMHMGVPHSTNLGYGFSKRMLDVQARTYKRQYGCNYINIIPNNLFGENDNFHLINSHVIPSVIRKVFEAKMSGSQLVLWGDGTPLREFTYSRDLARIIVFCFDHYDSVEPINVGNPGEYSIEHLAKMVCDILEYDGEILWNTDVSNGQPRKPSSNEKFARIGWDNNKYTPFDTALKSTCEWFLDKYPNVRGVQ